MKAPRKIIFFLLAAFSLCGTLAVTAGATEQPKLVEASVTDPSCTSSSTVVYVAHITNITDQPINLLAIDEFGDEQTIVEMPAGQSIEFEFSTGRYQAESGDIEVNAAIPRHEDEAGSFQTLHLPHAGLDCRNAHEPADMPTTTLPVVSTTSTVPQAVASTTTVAEIQPEARIADAVSQSREVPTTTALPAASVNELAYTGTRWIGTELKVVLTLLIAGGCSLHFARKLRKKERISRRKAAIAGARKG